MRKRRRCMETESILQSSAYTTTSTDTATPSNELDDDAFMTLFIAQLENQDPLNPMDNTDMLAQLAQFTTVEQLSSMNENIASMLDQSNAQVINSAVSYIGLDVVAEGDQVSVGDDGVSPLYYTLSDDATEAMAYIYDEDGSLVDTVALSDLEKGEHTFQWNGLNSDDAQVAKGNYSVGIIALDDQGDFIPVSTLCQGTVVGMSAQNGTTVFELADGRTVNMMSVTDVYTNSAS
ncbi:flagellar hook capping protein [Oceanidesulfovibrio marinus]|uniref:Basal-body rod modification protein FlgD n=2 Tax=Oceanidesulfovibrio marinus TaxID=370038 RepID=A0A6P1ZG09_9BACT|nr:flagellar hook capping protein [Oceanidesulfovibrio marinus]